MEDAYKTATWLSRKLIERDHPDAARRLVETQVIVVPGHYDRGESVFDLARIATTRVQPGALAGIALHPDQVVLVNCPGHVPPGGLRRLRAFVEQGGMLVTTDWALRYVLEEAFPGYVAVGGKPTRDDVVRVVFEETEEPFLDGLLDPKADPLWWLEGSSYPIHVLDPARVKVLVSSAEMERRYGRSPIVVAFEVGLGKVYHLTSHFYLQRAETRTARHAQSAARYLAEKGVALGELGPEERAAVEGCSLSALESAYTSSRAVANIVIEQSVRSETRRWS